MADELKPGVVHDIAQAEVSRRSFMKKAGAAGAAAGIAAAGVSASASAAPSAGSRRGAVRGQIDARTLVVLDDLPGQNWLYLDPAVIYEINPTAAINMIYECLYHLPDGANLTGFEPLLAEGMPEISADGLTATIKVKQGVKFHNSGNTMTAADWVFSWNRLKALQGNPSFLFTENITSVEAVDDQTLQLNLVVPNAALVPILSAIPFAVTDSKVIQEHGGVADNATPVVSGGALDPVTAWINEGNSAGTGPMRLTVWDTANEVELEAFPEYWGTKPGVDRIIFRNVKDANTQLQLIQTGEADMAFALDPDAAESVKSDPNMQILEGSSLAHEYIALHTSAEVGGPLSNQAVRQAIAHAIDYDGIINGLLGGAAVRPATIVPLGLLGAEDVLPNSYQTDLAKAQELYDSAGVGEVEITLTWGSGQATPAGLSRDILAAKYQEDLQKINGLTVSLNPMDAAQRLADYRNGLLQSTMSDWSPDYPDVHTYAHPFGHSGGAATKRVGFNNPEVDAMLDAGIAELDPEARKQYYIDVQKVIIETAAFLAIFQPIYRSPASVRVQGAQPHGLYILQLRGASKTE
jgi:peptide/nickel transport system substrate-binding protein